MRLSLQSGARRRSSSGTSATTGATGTGSGTSRRSSKSTNSTKSTKSTTSTKHRTTTSSTLTPRKPKVPGYSILDKLGEGAFATVWRGKLRSSSASNTNVLYDTERHHTVAIKIFNSKQSIQTGVKEIQTMRRWYNGAGRPRESMTVVTSRRPSFSFNHTSEKNDAESDEYKNDQEEPRETTGQLDLSQHCIAMESIGKLLGCLECTNGALALTYELCGATLASQLWKMRGEFYKSERIYTVTQSTLHRDLFLNDSKLLKVLVKTLLNVLLLFDDCGLLHCDIKPDNILIEYDESNQRFNSIKLIDFGSSIDVQNIVDHHGNLITSHLPSSTTPEYVSPELYRAREGAYGQTGGMTCDDCINPDMWALGSVMMEIVSGFPLWFPYKSRIPREGRKDYWMMKGGLLAVGARKPQAICRKQVHISDNLTETLKKCPGRGLSKDRMAMHFLNQMLTVDPHQRVRPAEQLEHPWLRDVVL